SIRTEENEIVDQLRVEVHVPTNEIVKADGARLHFEPYDVWLIRGRDGQNPAAAGIPISDSRAFGCQTLCLQLLHRAIAAIRASPSDQLLGALAIQRQAIALVNRSLVP